MKKVFLQFSTWAFFGKIGYVKIYILDKNCSFGIVCCCTATATEAHDTALACNTSIEASDSISWHRGKAFSRHSINDLLPISPWQTCQAFFLSLEKVARRENKEAFSVPAGIRVIRVVLVLPYKKKEVRIRVVAFTPFEMYDISVSES